MITLQEIKKYLEKSDNPLIFFDDDSDGLVSFLLLKRYFGKGKGVVVRNYPDFHEFFLKKVDEHVPDLILVLDVPDISHEFIERVNVPLIWIDHHPVVKRQGVHYFNPRLLDPKDRRSTSYWCYKIVNQDLWLAMAGIIGDWEAGITEEFKKFYKKYSDLLPKKKEPGEILYNSRFGILVKVLDFILKSRTSEVRKYVSILTKIRDPYEILDQKTARGRFIFKRFDKLNKEYELLLKKALIVKTNKKVLYFVYPSYKKSFTGALSNELMYRNPDKIILVAREKNGDMRFSIRTEKYDFHKFLEKSLAGLNGRSGGHEKACGGTIKKEDFKTFVDNLEKYCC